MATLAGGATINVTGATTQQLQTISNVLQSVVPAGSTPTNATVGTTAPVVTAPISNGSVLLGQATYTTVSTATVTKSAGASNDLSIVNLAGTNSTTSGTLTNLIVDSSLNQVFVQGTGNGNVSALFVGASPSNKLIVGDAGNQFVVGSSLTGSSTIIAGDGNDSVIGGTGSDSISANGNAILNGGAGNDVITGGAGFATLGGGAGNDTITAGSGGAIIIGEAGNDSLVAGAGKDVFIFTPGGGNDTVSGFNPTQDTLAFGTTNFGGNAQLNLVSLISSAQVTGGNTVLTLPDGSTITVVGQTGINVNWFTPK
ncbi:calcium-binding protein [Niveispirillum sp. BGYR6]|uniref:calcium-binding protein n=1 Tax=Niveispirillum sp. BGYR6 TaxID=2971249 RepID=UPI0022B981B4|nr:calcium-binding protein [Niveispirillum sp. BGYR6]MDG5496670.1 calcium-binding protein [Niveispirillum sp. BGYR6]